MIDIIHLLPLLFSLFITLTNDPKHDAPKSVNGAEICIGHCAPTQHNDIKSSPLLFNLQYFQHHLQSHPNEMITWRISLQEIPSFNSTQRQKGKQNLLATPARPQSALFKTKSRAKHSHYTVFQQEPLFTTKTHYPQKRKQSTKFSPKKQDICSWF